MSHSIALHGAFAMAHFFIPNPHPMIHSLQALRVLFAFCIIWDVSKQAVHVECLFSSCWEVLPCRQAMPIK